MIQQFTIIVSYFVYKRLQICNSPSNCMGGQLICRSTRIIDIGMFTCLNILIYSRKFAVNVLTVVFNFGTKQLCETEEIYTKR